MYKLDCPYSAIDIIYAKASLTLKLENYFKEHGEAGFNAKVAEIMEPFDIIQKQSLLNKAVADYHGISLEDLVNSPNMEILTNKFKDSMIDLLINKLKTEFGLNGAESWAILVAGYEASLGD